MLTACAAFLAVLSLDALLVAYLIGRSRITDAPPAPKPWFDHERFRRGLAGERQVGVVDRVRVARGVVVHPCSYGGDLIEYPAHAEFNELAVLATLAEIEAL